MAAEYGPSIQATQQVCCGSEVTLTNRDLKLDGGRQSAGAVSLREIIGLEGVELGADGKTVSYTQFLLPTNAFGARRNTIDSTSSFSQFRNLSHRSLSIGRASGTQGSLDTGSDLGDFMDYDPNLLDDPQWPCGKHKRVLIFPSYMVGLPVSTKSPAQIGGHSPLKGDVRTFTSTDPSGEDQAHPWSAEFEFTAVWSSSVAAGLHVHTEQTFGPRLGMTEFSPGKVKRGLAGPWVLSPGRLALTLAASRALVAVGGGGAALPEQSLGHACHTQHRCVVYYKGPQPSSRETSFLEANMKGDHRTGTHVEPLDCLQTLASDGVSQREGGCSQLSALLGT
ncbi:hypothetical protein P7K49_028285 [Saguinus oedipus]|uniref:Uncharacterized protein n=1 Tax=Saguinus oedipus TaxID=9490 RepID=A0ABQ9UBW1_SAGOE|nr:hypothetical protein P7K49_028285 [Saguinus oedipus]